MFKELGVENEHDLRLLEAEDLVEEVGDLINETGGGIWFLLWVCYGFVMMAFGQKQKS